MILTLRVGANQDQGAEKEVWTGTVESVEESVSRSEKRVPIEQETAQNATSVEVSMVFVTFAKPETRFVFHVGRLVISDQCANLPLAEIASIETNRVRLFMVRPTKCP